MAFARLALLFFFGARARAAPPYTTRCPACALAVEQPTYMQHCLLHLSVSMLLPSASSVLYLPCRGGAAHCTALHCARQTLYMAVRPRCCTRDSVVRAWRAWWHGLVHRWWLVNRSISGGDGRYADWTTRISLLAWHYSHRPHYHSHPIHHPPCHLPRAQHDARALTRRFPLGHSLLGVPTPLPVVRWDGQVWWWTHTHTPHLCLHTCLSTGLTAFPPHTPRTHTHTPHYPCLGTARSLPPSPTACCHACGHLLLRGVPGRGLRIFYLPFPHPDPCVPTPTYYLPPTVPAGVVWLVVRTVVFSGGYYYSGRSSILYWAFATTSCCIPHIFTRLGVVFYLPEPVPSLPSF